ncbi:hypothetical protein J2Z40_000285 [Cytobacillus eiseniae]|uniref:Uncharacterized protein n=1 Tax=Cytobacillus eiseniae TaxID=762947 RepID=A0ABS4RD01_9BACI|nr:hypothetical protein [Cytobacillus eiseniae]MBP2239732.1 hypothetical protein [Cytobacillus eiseniae]
MNKDKENDCLDDRDIMHHLMSEQIAYICVEEEEERMRKEVSQLKEQNT